MFQRLWQDYYNLIPILQENGRHVRDTLLIEPNGMLKMETIWRGGNIMNLLFGNCILKMVGNISKSELDRILIHNNIVISLGEDSYWENIFLLDIHSVNDNSRLLVPVFSESSIEPSIMINNNQLIVVFNKNIAFIDLDTQQVIIEKELPHNFIYAKYIGDKLVVIFEIGIVILNSKYQEIFNRPTDVIEKFEFLGNQILCKTCLGTEKVNIANIAV